MLNEKNDTIIQKSDYKEGDLMKINNDKEIEYDLIINDVQKKSEYMWQLIKNNTSKLGQVKIPNQIVQFWDNNDIPEDVKSCMNTWKRFSEKGTGYTLFDRLSAKKFIADNYSTKYVKAYDNCIHPAMQSDYFRLCYILVKGGAYIDADDVCLVSDIQDLFKVENLMVQTLCYDLDANEMVDSNVAYTNEIVNNRIYYVNNNPLIAPPHNAVIKRALEVATNNLLQRDDTVKDFQSIAGPGNLVNSILWNAIVKNNVPINFCFSWDTIAVSQWPLEYRNTNSNWRLWDGKEI